MLEPLASSQWTYTTAAHLLNRAGFGGAPAQIERLAALTPEKAVESFVDYENIPENVAAPEWAKPDPNWAAFRQKMRAASEEERKMLQRQERQTQFRQMFELREWWLARMASAQRPFQEKMTLFWHGHFATSVNKVRLAYFMWLQNETFRQKATGSWKDLLVAISQDPAMLIWLDNAQSKKDHPNENYARELMELFTLGEGHYTEKDVLESARAFTGWSLSREDQSFANRRRIHDTGSKTFLGRTGPFDGGDIIAVILEQPQAARFIMEKVWRFFASTTPSESLVESLAAALRKNNYVFKPVLKTMLLSQEFYAAEVIRQQIKSPVQWLISTSRQLEKDLPSKIVSHNILNNLGQELFNPPNVKGWDGGINWITTNNLLSRYNYSAMLVQGRAADKIAPEEKDMMLEGDKKQKVLNRLERFAPQTPPIDPQTLFTEEERSSREKLLSAMQRRFIQGPIKKSRLETLDTFLKQHPQFDDATIRTAVHLLMSTPDFQLT
jgi:uncharacterized protein (DUF1800 family)